MLAGIADGVTNDTATAERTLAARRELARPRRTIYPASPRPWLTRARLAELLPAMRPAASRTPTPRKVY